MNLDHTERVSEEAGEDVTCLLFKAQYLCKLLRSQRMIRIKVFVAFVKELFDIAGIRTESFRLL